MEQLNLFEDIERLEIIKRLENCKKHEDFYKRHPELLEKLNNKIKALQDGAKYKIKDAGWVIGYVGGCMRDTNIGYDNKVIQYEDRITEEVAKQCYEELFNK